MYKSKSFLAKIKILFYYYKLKVLSRFFSRKQNVSTKILSYNISAFNYSNLFYLYIEMFMNEEYKFDSDFSEPNIIDCGANIGMATIYFKYVYPNAKIIAFEPNPVAFYYLKKNIERNNLDVEIYNVALGNKKEQISFFYNQDNLFVGSMIESRGGQTHIKVEVVKLSEFLFSKKINLIKIDVEGHENFIIDDLSEGNVLANSEMYILEYHNNIDKHKNYLVDIINVFEKNNFIYTFNSSHPESFFQDINIRFYKKK